MNEGYLKQFEITQRHRDGSLIHVEVNASPTVYHGSTAILSLNHNMSKRKKVMTALAKSEEQYRELVEQAGVAILVDNVAGEFVYFNNQFCELFGYSREEMEKDMHPTLIHPDDVQRVWTIHSNRIEGKNPRQYEFQGLKKDKSVINVEVVATMLKEGGIVKGTRSYIWDITERRQAEIALKNNESNLKAVIENSLASIWSVNTNYEIQYTNKIFADAFYETFGTKLFRGANILQALPDSLKPILEELYDRTFKNESIVLEDKIDLDENHIYIEITAMPILVDDKVIGASCYGRNITKRKLAETEIEQALIEARNASDVKDQFIANISHEIRTPLNSILGLSDILRQRFGDLLAEIDRDIFGIIGTSSNRLIHTIDSILNISQLKAGTIRPFPQDLDVFSIASEVVEQLKLHAKKKNLNLHLVPAREPTIVLADEYCLHQSITNLTENAIKYTDEGSVELMFSKRDGHLRLSISDTGIGISDEYKTRIFESYSQESEGYTKDYQGIGLGLALTKRYLELNNVELDFESKKFKGTTFILTFQKYKENS